MVNNTTDRESQMLQQKQAEKESKLFTGRASHIKKIEDSISKNNITAVVSLPGMGRTALLRQFSAKQDRILMDLRKLSMTPESFAVEFIGTLCFIEKSGKPEELIEFMTIDKLKGLGLGKVCDRIIGTVDNELQKIKPNQELLLSSAFSFPEALSSEMKKRLVISINNFEEILKLNNFSQISDVMKIFFDSIEKDKDCSFVLASSAAYTMRPLFRKFVKEIVELDPLSSKESAELFEKVAGKSDERVTKEVGRLCGGIPSVIRSVASRFRAEQARDVQENIKLVRYILASELAHVNSSPHFYCSRMLTESLNRARGESLLKNILKVVSQGEPMRLTEIARRIYRSGPVTKSLIERLIEVDLLSKSGNTFDFTNPVLKSWCRMSFLGIEFSDVPDRKSLENAGGMR